jgi:putative PIN family toxin of toxin-antitoxin system
VNVGHRSNDSSRPRHEYLNFRVVATRGFARPDLLDGSRRGHSAQLCVRGDSDIYAEYEEVIRRPKFNRSETVIEHALRAIRQNGFWVKPSEKVRACFDPDDDIFLECAQAARAHYLVTGNLKDFPVRWAAAQIVTARQFLDAMAKIQEGPR